MTAFRRSGRRRSFGSRGFRPQTDWATADVCGNVTEGAPDVFNLTSLADPEYFERSPETVRRIRGTSTLWAPQATFDVLSCLLVAEGIGVAPPEAVDAAAVPNPVEDASWDGWMWIRVNTFVIGTLLAPFFDLTPTRDPTLDTRAQRKLDDNVLFYSIAMVSDGGDAQSISYHAFFRWLLSLSGRR